MPDRRRMNRTNHPNRLTSLTRLQSFPIFVVSVVLAPWLWIALSFFMRRGAHRLSWTVVVGLEYRWQTLIAGAIAIQAAAIGGYFIYQQILRDNDAEEMARRRRFRTERAIMPMILSDLSDYLRTSAHYAADLLAKVRAKTVTVEPPAPTRLDDKLVQQLRGLVEGGDDTLTTAAEHLLRKLQIYGARMAGLPLSTGYPSFVPPLETTILDRLADTAELYAIVDRLFPFARYDTDVISTDITPTQIRASAFVMLPSSPDVDGLNQAIEQRYKVTAVVAEATMRGDDGQQPVWWAALWVWKWQWQIPYPWMKDALPILLLVSVCTANGLAPLIAPARAQPNAPVGTDLFDAPAEIVITLYRSTGAIMLDTMLVVLAMTLVAYGLRQKVRAVYGVFELVIGVSVAGVALAQSATHIGIGDRTPTIANSDFFRLVTGIYFVIRGMTNTRDGINVRTGKQL